MSDANQKSASVNVPGTTSPSPQQSWVPSQKVLAGGLGGLVAWAITYLLQKYAGITLDPEVKSWLVGAATIGITYITPVRAQDVVRQLNNEIVAMAQADPKSPVTVPVVTQAQAIPVVVGTQVPGEDPVMNKGSQE